jgi:hypothetical protein
MDDFTSLPNFMANRLRLQGFYSAMAVSPPGPGGAPLKGRAGVAAKVVYNIRQKSLLQNAAGLTLILNPPKSPAVHLRGL